MSRESEKLLKAITEAADGQIEEAQGSLRRRGKIRWIAPLAAVVALAILLTAVLSGPGGSGSSAYALAEAKYPAENLIRTPPAEAETTAHFLRLSVPALLAGAEGENRVCSPLNIYLALSMLAETAAGESRAQILDLLGGADMETQRQTARQLWERLYYTGDYGACLLASSLWLDEDISYKRETLKLLAEDYYASVFRGDLGSEKLNEALRDWLNEQTGGFLKEQAAKVTLPPDTVLALAATVYFKGSWAYEFNKNATSEQVFTGPKGEAPCDFMHGSERGSYYWGESFTAAAKGFTNGRSMLFILPEEGLTPEDLLTEGDFMDFLTGERNAWTQKETVILNFAVPRFDVCCDMDLKPVLAALGVTDVLDPLRADFSSVMDSCAALTTAKHAARVRVDEEGCEAAAFTVFGMSGGASLTPPREVDFTLDRPFLFAILSTEGRPMFVGIVNEPAGAP